METRAWITRVLFSAAAVFTGTACPGLNQANVDGTGESDDGGSTATTLPTTAGMTMTTAGTTMTGGGSGDATSTSDGDTTVGVSATDGMTMDGPGPTTDGETTVGEDTVGDTTSASTTDPPDESTSTGACSPSGDGTWADCPGQSCDSEAGSCVGVASQGTSCMFQCTDICDCPPVPGSGNPTPMCDDVAGPGGNLDGNPECYLSCEGGETCPDGMECLASQFCAYSDAVPYYEGCDTFGFSCLADANCFDAGMGTSACLPDDCSMPSDCPNYPGATVACGNVAFGPGNECYLECSNNGDCPNGTCFNNTLCVQSDP